MVNLFSNSINNQHFFDDYVYKNNLLNLSFVNLRMKLELTFMVIISP